MSYEVLNGTVGKTGMSLCVTIPKDYVKRQRIVYKRPLKKVMRDGFMVVIFKKLSDERVIELVKKIDEVKVT